MYNQNGHKEKSAFKILTGKSSRRVLGRTKGRYEGSITAVLK